MANMLLPLEERDLSPNEIAAIDRRRTRGFMLLVIASQFGLVAIVLLLWLGQDVQYSPGWARPILYYFLTALCVSGVTGVSGLYLRRGTPEF